MAIPTGPGLPAEPSPLPPWRHLLRMSLIAQEEQRQRLASQLLDDTGQALATVLLQLRLLRDAAAQPGADAVAIGGQAYGLADLVRATLAGVRRLADDLHPRELDDLGLAAAVQSMAEAWQTGTGIPVEVRCSIPANVRVPPAVGIAVYRMMQEALANVASHAHASGVSATLEYANGHLVAQVRDDGRGFLAPANAAGAAGAGTALGLEGAPVDSPPPRLGLVASRERIGLVGGRCIVESAPGHGTTVRAVVPLPAGGPDSGPVRAAGNSASYASQARENAATAPARRLARPAT